MSKKHFLPIIALLVVQTGLLAKPVVVLSQAPTPTSPIVALPTETPTPTPLIVVLPTETPTPTPTPTSTPTPAPTSAPLPEDKAPLPSPTVIPPTPTPDINNLPDSSLRFVLPTPQSEAEVVATPTPEVTSAAASVDEESLPIVNIIFIYDTEGTEGDEQETRADTFIVNGRVCLFPKESAQSECRDDGAVPVLDARIIYKGEDGQMRETRTNAEGAYSIVALRGSLVQVDLTSASDPLGLLGKDAEVLGERIKPASALTDFAFSIRAVADGQQVGGQTPIIRLVAPILLISSALSLIGLLLLMLIMRTIGASRSPRLAEFMLFATPFRLSVDAAAQVIASVLFRRAPLTRKPQMTILDGGGIVIDAEGSSALLSSDDRPAGQVDRAEYARHPRRLRLVKAERMAIAKAIFAIGQSELIRISPLKIFAFVSGRVRR